MTHSFPTRRSSDLFRNCKRSRDMSAQGVKEVDVVVVGGGLAGHSAAIEASKAGKSVVVLEKMPEIGGSTVLSGGSFAFAGTPDQAEQEIGRAHVLTPVTNAQLVFRLLLEKK